MPRIKWVKQLTRENTLLDRSLRAVAYATSLKEIGKASIKCPCVGQGSITSMYYSPQNYRYQQNVILREFKGKNKEKMGQKVITFLEQACLWAKKNKNKQIALTDFLRYFQEFNKHHAHARGAIVYGYWGEPAVTEKLKKILSKKIDDAELDNTLSVLSAPKPIDSPLNKLFHSSLEITAQKKELIKKLNLNQQELERVDTLAWFTLFYELGERVSALLYDNFLKHLQQLAGNKKIFNELQWYDPESLKKYFKGQRLESKELSDRKQFFVITIAKDEPKILSGLRAKNYYDQNFKENLLLKFDDQEIKGTIASLGQAKGVAKIIITKADQKKMKKGDILVSPMTTPYLMSAVNKAAAIVTDEGGLTAHAAIVSRELNIPCIVGTKIATKVLKDGDMVEVDADKGTVKRLL